MDAVGGIPTRVRTYFDHAEALEAVGLREQALSEDNVEVVRRAVEAFNARDVERGLSLTDPEIEYRSVVEDKVYRGHAALVRFWLDVDAAMEEWHLDDNRFFDAGGDRVVHLYRVVGREGKRRPGDRGFRDLVSASRRQAPQRRGLSRSATGARSRRAAGVGSVAGERCGRAQTTPGAGWVEPDARSAVCVALPAAGLCECASVRQTAADLAYSAGAVVADRPAQGRGVQPA
jgi:hypothetical protein